MRRRRTASCTSPLVRQQGGEQKERFCAGCGRGGSMRSRPRLASKAAEHAPRRACSRAAAGLHVTRQLIAEMEANATAAGGDAEGEEEEEGAGCLTGIAPTKQLCCCGCQAALTGQADRECMPQRVLPLQLCAPCPRMRCAPCPRMRRPPLCAPPASPRSPPCWPRSQQRTATTASGLRSRVRSSWRRWRRPLRRLSSVRCVHGAGVAQGGAI